MRQSVLTLLVPLTLASAACHGNDGNKVDAALDSDLSMAGRSFTPLDTLSPAEQAQQQKATAAAQPAPVRERVVYRDAPRSSAAAAPAPKAPVYRTQKNTGRDAAIGAGAGAVLGAVTSKNKVKGGVIGAAAGGILGAVLGNNVDKKKVPVNE